ncbi:MAG: 2-oxoglutarate dehydrogenase E1 component [Planctomycetota bacterium]|nr:MAG: 2-oxoglutarate dehydrogenase E1 component [Planctomycetota bacterium]
MPYVEALYRRYREDPNSVDESWRRYFARLGGNGDGALAPPVAPIRRSIFAGGCRSAATVDPDVMASARRAGRADRVAQLVHAYRMRGHLYARLDPLGLHEPPARHFPLEEFGLDEGDLDVTFTAGGLRGTLRELIELLEETYCRTIGVEIGHLDQDAEAQQWLIERMERTRNRPELSRASYLHLLTKLTDAEIFERFLHTKFVGAKRFSLEGAESLIPLVEFLIYRCAKGGVDEVVIGMAHRGRLNVLANVLEKPVEEIFAEFADEDAERFLGRGDVKYHLGYAHNRDVGGRTVHLSLTYNPSHLEFVDPVVVGRVRAKQDRYGDAERRQVLPLLIHGDAAFAGQGIVAELLNMSGLEGFTVGGTVHVIVNNQIGFTTEPNEARSSHYPTDVAKMLQVPIFHVNGEDPEAVVQVVRLAVDFRNAFQREAIIDLWCYRRHGHNEGDEPSYTQPVMYRRIKDRPTVREQFVRRLVELGVVTEAEANALAEQRRARLEQHLQHFREAERSWSDVEENEIYRYTPISRTGAVWVGYRGGPDAEVPDVPTRLPAARLEALMQEATRLPDDFHLHPKLRRLFEARRAMGRGERPFDWGGAEIAAYASLLSEGVPLRLTGQDVRRGTFSHRHAYVFDVESGRPFSPLTNVVRPPARLDIYNSPLSEQSVVGYEFGYSRDMPMGLVMWEAQFGDFANGAQVIIDQFITSVEDKWHRLSGIVLLLPHGFEGQGPEHSSARLERWLQLCAEDNIQVVNLTTPAQIFHALRRQVLRPWRKPLIVMSPKSLLRHPRAVSSREELATGEFRHTIGDPRFEGPDAADPAGVRRVLLCSGKIYYELEARREQLGRDDVAIVRLEQLYPLREAPLRAALAPFAAARQFYWVQEEPRNQGAWTYVWTTFTERRLLPGPLHAISRHASASPATGSHASHKLEQEQIIAAAFDPALEGSFVTSNR